MAFITFYHVSAQDVDQLSAGLFGTDHHWEYVSEPADLSNLKPDSEVISVSCGNPIGRDIIEALPRLQLIAVRCSDVNLVDLVAATERGITVTYVPEDLGELNETINRITDVSITRFWYGETPYKVGLPAERFGRLVLTRHSESEYNRDGKWTGSHDPHLTEKGFADAALVGRTIKDIRIDYAYSSQQQRSIETLENNMNGAGQYDIPYEHTAMFNERDYGDFTAMNKWEVKEKIGEEKFLALRRGWDTPVPNGETLQDVYNRTVPFFLENVLPRLKEGKTVLVSAHGNSLRCLMKHIERIPDDQIGSTEFPFENIVIYDVSSDGHIVKKEVRTVDISPINA